MRRGSVPLLVLVAASVGCFEEPETELSTGDMSTSGPDTTDGGPSTDQNAETTSGGDTTASTSSGLSAGSSGGGTSSSGGSADTTSGPEGDALSLFRLACDEAKWTGPAGALGCGESGPGAQILAHDNYQFANLALERVIEVRPVSVPGSPVDGVFSIDTSGFAQARFVSEVVCGVSRGCAVDYLITAEEGREVLTQSGGQVAKGGSIAEVAFDIPSQPGLVIHVNVSSADVGGDNRFLWIDPRVVDSAP